VSRLSTILALAIACGLTARTVVADEFVYHHENVLGTSLELRVTARSETDARAAEDRVLREVDRLATIFSGYDEASEFRRWMATSNVPTRLSPELFEVLQACDRWMLAGGGAFDPRVEALTRLWSKCARDDRVPTPAEIAEARALMARPAWRLDPAAGTAERLSSCPLSLNAIAKGYIVGRAAEAGLDRSQGIQGLLLNIGGDLRASGEIPRRIGIVSPWADSETAGPITRIEVKDRSVATSGRSQRGLTIRGKWYSHIFNPDTGLPVEHVVAATVIAERSMDADAIAKVVGVLPVEEGLRFVKSLPGVECLLISTDGSISRSPGFARYERTRVALASFRALEAEPKPDGGPAWEPGFELAIKFETGSSEGEVRRYRRPYVAIFIEDKDGLSVRTLWLSVQAKSPGPRWIPDLKRWYKDDQVRRLVDDTDLVETTARPTRPPGKYDVAWDGKDDQGKPVPAGEYTINIEAAREHGTYQLIRKSVTLGSKPFAETLKGNVEIKSASIEYRRKASPK
jgi:thiamine biosynthesis lipoprotein ApbE